MEDFSYSKSYRAGTKVRAKKTVYLAIRDVPQGISITDTYFWKVSNDDGEASGANVRPRNPDDDGDGLLVGALEIGGELFSNAGDVASAVFEGAGGLFEGAGAIGID